MKTGEAAALLGVSINTARNWIDREELSHFFSDGAKGKHGGAQRVLSESDILMLNTIRHLRNVENINDWQIILERLEDGFRIQEFPDNAISGDPRVIPLPQAQQSAMAAATLAQRDLALDRIDELTDELARVRQEYDMRLKLERERNDELQQQIAQLNREIGRLEARLDDDD